MVIFMNYIMEHYGGGLLAVLGGAAALAIYFASIKSGGILYEIVCTYMDSICG